MSAVPAELDNATWSEAIGGSAGPKVVRFHASWCGPCKQMQPIVSKLATEYAGRVETYSLDVDASGSIAARFGVRSLPAFGLFCGGQMTRLLQGTMPESVMRQALDQHLKQCALS